MGNTYQRKATFTVEGKKGSRVFHPVNKRAHNVAKRLGKRTNVPEAMLKATIGKGSYVFYAYDSKGVLKPISF